MDKKSDSLERFYLRLFKQVVIFIMSLALIATLGALGYAAKLYFQSPKEPEPAKTAPATGVDVDSFLKTLEEKKPEEAPKTDDQKPEEAKPVEPKKTDKYLTEARQIAGCWRNFNKAIGKPEPTKTLEEQTTEFRQTLERIADAANKNRGQAYATDSSKFACVISTNEKIKTYGKSNSEKDVFVNGLNFHIRAWDDLKAKEAQFNQQEEKRVAKERADEEQRVAIEKAQSMMFLTIAGVAFGLMMVLALYLIFSAIESNLRNLSHSLSEIKERANRESFSDLQPTIEPTL
ncbi:MAG: hypothetical protein ACO222_03365 [Polynucleobacter sp.]|jgi:hypothetical protein